MAKIILELLTGEKLKCTGCGKMIEAEKVYLGKRDKDGLVNEIHCGKCHETT